VDVVNDSGCTARSAAFVVSDIVHLGVNSINTAINVYPNPASSTVHIASPVKVNVYITALDGRKMLEQHDAADVDITSLANGVYLMRITDTNGKDLKMEKLVKQAQ